MLVCLAPIAFARSGPAHAQAPLRVLLVGDSVTMGSSGDWTWRYRLWQHFGSDGQPVDFVGPRTDLADNITGQLGSHAYVDPAFDQDHAARWGMTLGFMDTPIDQLMSTYHPDVVVEMLGINDLIYLTRTPAQIADNLGSLVASARSVDPNVDVVLVRQTQTWYPGVPELDQDITALAPTLDTPASRVVVADADVGYELDTDTWDTAHPDAEGELKIAASVEDALALIGDDTPATRPLPQLPLGPRLAATLSGQIDGSSIDLFWSQSAGATVTELQEQDLTAGTGWQVVEAATPDVSSDRIDGLPLGHTVRFRVLPQKGKWLAQDDVASDVVTDAIPSGPPAAPSPTVRVRRKSPRNAAATWPAVAEATTYEVRVRRHGRPWQTVATGLTGTGFELGELRRHRRYDVQVDASNQLGTGPWSPVVSFHVAG